MSLTEHIKTHKNAYSLGFLAVVAAVVGFLFIQVDDLSNSQLTGSLTNSRMPIKKVAVGSPSFKRPELVTAGTLSISSEGNPDSKILIAGAPMQLVSKYRLSAIREGFTVKKLTVMNDLSGAFDAPANTLAASSVTLKYTDANGASQTLSASLSMGRATFSGLNLNVAAGQNAYAEIFADINYMGGVGEILSGQTLRLGIQEAGNDASTFEAVGDSSFTSINTPTISNGASVNSFVVRKSMPTFSKAVGLSTSLIAGENRLYGLTVTADIAGPVSFGRLSFKISNNSTDNPLVQFKFYRESTLMSGVSILNANNGTDLTTVGTVAAGEISGALVIFDQEETVEAGQSKTYYLDAILSSAMMNDSVTTRLASDPIENAQTGNFANFQSSAIVWSDNSADMHVYPTVAAGVATPGTGSNDWTNGALLGTASIPSQTLMR